MDDAYSAIAVVPSDAGANGYDRLYIGGAGNVTIETIGGNVVTFAGCTPGSYIWCNTKRVKATGTTAT